MICNSLTSNLCGTYQNKTAKCFITIDTNHNLPAEIDEGSKFFISEVPIDITEQKHLICAIMNFPEELKSQMLTLIKIFADYSDQTNHLSRKIEVTIKEKIGLDFMIGTLYQWFTIPDNSGKHALMLVFDKDELFPLF